LNNEIIQIYNQHLTTHSDVDQLIAYYQDKTGNVVLSKKLEELDKRLHFAADLLRRYSSAFKIVPMLKKEFNYSQASAYRDLTAAEYFFGTTLSHNRDIRIDRLLDKTNELYKKAIAKEDFRTAALVIREEKEIIVKLIGDRQLLPYDKILPPRIIIGFFPQIQNVQLPDNWEEIVERLKKAKLKKTLQFDDAEIMDDTNGSTG